MSSTKFLILALAGFVVGGPGGMLIACAIGFVLMNNNGGE